MKTRRRLPTALRNIRRCGQEESLSHAFRHIRPHLCLAPAWGSRDAQPPGVEVELWLEKTEQALPRRLVVTYRSVPGQPNFVAEFSNWNFAVAPTDADFAFKPPAGATQVDLTAATARSVKGAKQ